MTNLNRYKLHLVAVFIVVAAGVVLWAELDGPDLQSCSELLSENGIAVSTPVDTGSICDDLEYEDAINASEEVAICDESASSLDSQNPETPRNRVAQSDDCSIITQNPEFQTDAK